MYKIIIASILVLLMTSCTGLEIGSGMLMGSQILSMVDNSISQRKFIKERKIENEFMRRNTEATERLARALEDIESVRKAKLLLKTEGY